MQEASLTYHVRDSNGTELRVCKKAFCDVHSIGRKRVEGLCRRLGSGELIASDNRGKHRTRPHAISDDIKDQVREHIRSFPRRQSHYSRADNHTREYLPEGLSISEMYRFYRVKYESQTDKPIQNLHSGVQFIIRLPSQ